MSKAFWNKEYADPKHITMSFEPAGDLQSFERWGIRNAEWYPFPKDGLVLDIGCGNGRNIIYLCEKYGMKGFGVDVSGVAIDQAKEHTRQAPAIAAKALADEASGSAGQVLWQKNSWQKPAPEKLASQNTALEKLDINYAIQSGGENIPLEDASVDVVLDMMTSHMLRKKEREAMVKEIARVAKPYAWFFFKTFILDADVHAKRLIQDHPDLGGEGQPPEENSYIHPRIGVYEHVWTEQEIYEFFRPYFKIHKMIKSYKHFRDGKPYKRRTVSVYMERLRD